MRRVATLLLAAFVAIPIVAAAYTNPGMPRGFVNDFAGMLQPQEKVQLEQKIASFASSTSNEIAIVTIKSLDGDTIENFAEKLFADWKIGKTKKDNGVLLLISRDDRKMRIEVGYGLEGALTDIQSDEIITNDLVPNFKAGNYYAGIDAAVRDIMAATQGEYTSSAQDKRVVNVLFDYWYFIPLVFVWLASILGRSKSWWAGGVLGGVIGVIIGLIKGFLFIGVVSIGVLIPIGLIFDYFVSRSFDKYKNGGGVPPWWLGGGGRGGFGGGSGGGGGFGGFGGGRSGGGGASGDW